MDHVRTLLQPGSPSQRDRGRRARPRRLPAGPDLQRHHQGGAGPRHLGGAADAAGTLPQRHVRGRRRQRHAAARNRARTRAPRWPRSSASTSCAPRSPSRIAARQWRWPSSSAPVPKRCCPSKGRPPSSIPAWPNSAFACWRRQARPPRCSRRAAAREAPLAAYDALRLELGVPDGSRDLIVDKALLLENGFDELNGVDWQKGCYMGQELTARTKYRALIRKRLFPVRIEGALPAPGTVHLQGRPGGRRTALGFGSARACHAAPGGRDSRPEAAGGRRRCLAGNSGLDAASRHGRPLAASPSPGLRSPRVTGVRRAALEIGSIPTPSPPVRRSSAPSAWSPPPTGSPRRSAWASSRGAATPSMPPSPPPSPCRSSSRISAGRAATCR